MDNEFNHGKNAVDAFARDVAALAQGVAGKNPEDISFDAIMEYLELLKSEAERVKDGIYARDNSILYTNPDGVSFDKSHVK